MSDERDDGMSGDERDGRDGRDDDNDNIIRKLEQMLMTISI